MSKHRAAEQQADTHPGDGPNLAVAVLLVIVGTVLVILVGVVFGDGSAGPPPAATVGGP